MIGAVIGIAGLVLAVWAVVVGIVVLQERRFIFFPTRGHLAKPDAYGLRAEELRVTAEDGTELSGWWIHGSSGRVLVWYHGNAGNIVDRLDNARLLIKRLGVDIVLVDYRGYGLSQGKPDEQGLYLDGVAIYDSVVKHGIRPEDIVLFGRSLGGAIAVEVALQRPAGALVLESAFRSVPTLARVHYWFVPPAAIRTKLDTESKIHRVQPPKLFLHGDRDEIVPFDHGRVLFTRAKDPKRFYVIKGAGHNDTYLVGGEPYLATWESFLKATRVGA